MMDTTESKAEEFGEQVGSFGNDLAEGVQETKEHVV
jgi:hypothetical protein